MNKHSGPIPVDLVIMIDTSASMKDEAVGLSEAANAAIEKASGSCPSDLRVVWLGLEGVWKGTHFDQSVHTYLGKLGGGSKMKLRGRKKGEVADGGAQEDGARNMEDITLHFDWREGAARAIFYLSDEGLEGGGDKITPEATAAADKAIETAQEGAITLHTYFGSTKSKFKADLQREFARVAHGTGGQAFTEADSIGGFTEALEKVICASRVAPEEKKRSHGVAPAAHQGHM